MPVLLPSSYTLTGKGHNNPTGKGHNNPTGKGHNNPTDKGYNPTGKGHNNPTALHRSDLDEKQQKILARGGRPELEIYLALPNGFQREIFELGGLRGLATHKKHVEHVIDSKRFCTAEGEVKKYERIECEMTTLINYIKNDPRNKYKIERLSEIESENPDEFAYVHILDLCRKLCKYSPPDSSNDAKEKLIQHGQGEYSIAVATMLIDTKQLVDNPDLFVNIKEILIQYGRGKYTREVATRLIDTLNSPKPSNKGACGLLVDNPDVFVDILFEIAQKYPEVITIEIVNSLKKDFNLIALEKIRELLTRIVEAYPEVVATVLNENRERLRLIVEKYPEVVATVLIKMRMDHYVNLKESIYEGIKPSEREVFIPSK